MSEMTRLAVHGVGAGALAGATYGFSRSVQLKPFGGSKLADVPVWALAAAVGVGSALATDAVHTYVLPHVSKDKKWRNREALALGIGASSAAYAGLVWAANPAALSNIPIKNIVMGGAAIEAAGTYATSLYEGTPV